MYGHYNIKIVLMTRRLTNRTSIDKRYVDIRENMKYRYIM